VAGNGEQVDAQCVHVGGDLSHRLGGVGMDENAVLAGDAADLGDRLDGAHLIVGMHDADENGLRRNRPGHIVGIDPAEAVDRNDAHVEALPIQEAAGPEDCPMLDGTDNDVVALAPQRPGHPFEREVVGLAAAAREDDLVALGAEHRRDLAARFLKCGLRTRSRPMPARRIAEMIFQVRPHRRGDRGIDRRAGVVVEVDGRHGQNRPVP
jgi:hypothetical protein